MAGRGCTVKIQILRQEGQSVQTDEVSLPVALHSPLVVLRALLQAVSHIDAADQVLILCDLSDPDRNNDVHLDSSKDEMTLFQCGVQQGSVLGLHALGISGNLAHRFDDLHSQAAKQAQLCTDPRPIHRIETDITPEQANHSYNGIVFNICSKSPYELDVRSVSVGGMLGRVRVFFKHGSWLQSEDGSDEEDTPHRWWGASERVSRKGWELAADSICAPSWDTGREILFRKPINMLPGQTVAVYLHSGLPDDLGIQYQTYNKESIVAEDEHISVLPGLGHTGSQPFDEVHGWYRAYRGLAGGMSYRCRRKGWTIWDHTLFPEHFQEGVLTMLMCRERSLNVLYRRRHLLLPAYASYALQDPSAISTMTPNPNLDRKRELGLLHTHILYYIMEFMVS
jgi:hypothetical protein